jgi:hypothetical protein
MSGALLGISAVGGIAQQALQATGLMPAWFRAPRSIGDSSSKGGAIIPDVTIEEQHSDRLTVTQHPIADGSPIHDHAYKLPATVVMRIGFSNSNIVGAAVQGFQSGGGFSDIGGGLAGAGQGLLSAATEQRCNDIYKKLVKLQFDQEAWDQGMAPLAAFSLTTGKRPYKNMVITELSMRNDKTTEYALIIEVHMQEVFIVKTASTTQPSQTNQSNPEKTASPTDQTDKSATPTPNPNSFIKRGADFFFGA